MAEPAEVEIVEPPRLRVLLIEDDPDHAMLIKAVLKSVPGEQYQLVNAPDLHEAISQLQRSEFDVVLLDLHLPDSSGLDTVVRTHEAARRVPIVVMTATNDEALAIQALKSGAQDYLVKSQLNTGLLPRTLRYARERQRILDELEEARREQLEFKDALLSHVSHEVRTPLTACHQFVSIVLDEIPGPLNEEQREYLEIAFRNVNQLSKMVGDLLDVSRAQSGKLALDRRVIDLVDLLEEVVATWRPRTSARGISLEAQLAPLACVADESRVRQVLGNLLENALKFTPEGGSITVACARDATDPDCIQVSVADSGCGIAESSLRSIFDRLHQEQESSESTRKGLGLGLHIAQQLIEQQGGRIWVESKEGEGSTFRFTLPAFSVARLIRPAVFEGRELRDECSLVRVALKRPDGGSSAGIPESAVASVYEAFGSTLYYHEDVMLPRWSRSGDDEALFALVASGEIGKDAVTRRLRSQLESLDELARTSFRVEIDGRVESTQAEGIRYDDLPSRLEALAGRIHELITNPDCWRS